jgi:hypothetical protein
VETIFEQSLQYTFPPALGTNGASNCFLHLGHGSYGMFGFVIERFIN